MSKIVIENIRSDEQLPSETRARVERLVAAGWIREALWIAPNGEVLIDHELVRHDLDMQKQYPGLPRSEYMTVRYPERIVVSK